jgi:uncharacterized protein YdeI (YjbR/CyaY-like superfamily)
MEELIFETRTDWRQWLAENHDKTEGIWMVYYKKHTKKMCVSYNDAVEEALCYGWIDSIVKTVDSEKYKQKYTPRRKNSVWSKVNKSRVEKMIKAGMMTPFGLTKIEEAKQNGQWDKAYGARKMPKIPSEFKKALEKDIEAYTNFMNFAKSYQSSYLHWYLNAKRPETKEKRLKEIIQRSRENKKPGMV